MSKWQSDIDFRIKKINAQITTVQRIFGTDSQIYKRITSTIKNAGGNTRFSKKMFSGNMRQIAKAERALSTIEASKYLTKSGRAQIGAKARETFALNHSDYSDTVMSQLFYIFQNSSQYKKVGEVFSGSSEIVLDAIAQALEIYDIDEKDMAEFMDVFLPYAFGKAKGTREQQLSQVVEMFWEQLEPAEEEEEE